MVRLWRFGMGCGAAVLVVLTACGGSTFKTSDAGTGGSGAAGGHASGGAPATGGSAGAPATGGSAGTGPSCSRACTVPTDCTLTPASCCICGEGQLSDYFAVNNSNASLCGCQGPACECATMSNPNLGATCSSGKCTGFDVRQVPALSACNTNADCTLRIGDGCCPGCLADVSKLIAIRTDAESKLEQMVCGPTGSTCPNCMPAMPPGTTAQCVNGRCQVVTQ